MATAVASLFAEATFVRWTQRRTAHLGAWTIAARDVRRCLGGARRRRLDGMGQRHVPRLLPARRGAQRPVARLRHAVPAVDERRGAATRPHDARVLLRARGRCAAQRTHGAGVGHDHPGRQRRVRRVPACARRDRERRRRDRDPGGRVLVGVPLSARSIGASSCSLGRRERAHRARHPRAVERRARPGCRGPRRGVHAQPRDRDQRDLCRVPRGGGTARARRQSAVTA